jgi:hypothetical protein
MLPTVTITHYSIKVHFGEHLHLYVPMKDFLGIEAWKDSPTNFSISFALKGGSIHSQYDDQDRWLSILHQLDSLLE